MPCNTDVGMHTGRCPTLHQKSVMFVEFIRKSFENNSSQRVVVNAGITQILSDIWGGGKSFTGKSPDRLRHEESSNWRQLKHLRLYTGITQLLHDIWGGGKSFTGKSPDRLRHEESLNWRQIKRLRLYTGELHLHGPLEHHHTETTTNTTNGQAADPNQASHRSAHTDWRNKKKDVVRTP